MPLAVQEKLLRVVEYGTFERVGSSEAIAVDVRLVAATSVDLCSLVTEGRFKADLLDRLSFQVLYLPPLRFGREISSRSRIILPNALRLNWVEVDAFVQSVRLGRTSTVRLAWKRPGTQECRRTRGVSF